MTHIHFSVFSIRDSHFFVLDFFDVCEQIELQLELNLVLQTSKQACAQFTNRNEWLHLFIIRIARVLSSRPFEFQSGYAHLHARFVCRWVSLISIYAYIVISAQKIQFYTKLFYAEIRTISRISVFIFRSDVKSSPIFHFLHYVYDSKLILVH